MANKLIAIALWVFAAALVAYDIYLIAVGQAGHGFYIYPLAFAAFGGMAWYLDRIDTAGGPPPNSFLHRDNLPKDRQNGFD